MPFTLSHPITVLIVPKSKYLHQGALVVGSMSPDFINYLNITTFTKFGHTSLGAFILDLPLCFIIYYLYLYLIQPYFWRYLPNIVSLQTDEKPISSVYLAIVFSVSALIGTFSHIFLDWLLHRTSDILVTFDFIQPYHQGLRVYRLYHASISVICLLIILCYLIVTVKKQRREFSVTPKITAIGEKIVYWLFVICIGVATWQMWQHFNPVFSGIESYIVRIVDAFFIGLLLTGFIYRLYTNKGDLQIQ